MCFIVVPLCALAVQAAASPGTAPVPGAKLRSGRRSALLLGGLLAGLIPVGVLLVVGAAGRSRGTLHELLDALFVLLTYLCVARAMMFTLVVGSGVGAAAAFFAYRLASSRTAAAPDGEDPATTTLTPSPPR